ncbi:hypothetical protein BJX70DRAFT_361969 [Aspergillus crustosus]
MKALIESISAADYYFSSQLSPDAFHGWELYVLQICTDCSTAFFDGTRRTLPLLDWQLIVLRISAVLNAEYEWDVNAPVAWLNGMPGEKIDALKRSVGNDPEGLRREAAFSDRDRVILQLVDEQLARYDNTEETVVAAKKVLTVEELVEVYVVLGVYVLIAWITKGLRIDMDGEIQGLEEHLKAVVTSGSIYIYVCLADPRSVGVLRLRSQQSGFWISF